MNYVILFTLDASFRASRGTRFRCGNARRRARYREERGKTCGFKRRNNDRARMNEIETRSASGEIVSDFHFRLCTSPTRRLFRSVNTRNIQCTSSTHVKERIPRIPGIPRLLDPKSADGRGNWKNSDSSSGANIWTIPSCGRRIISGVTRDRASCSYAEIRSPPRTRRAPTIPSRCQRAL